MPESRARLFVGSRVVVGVAAAVVGAGVIAAASLLPLPTVVATPPSVTVTPEPAVSQLVCPGAVLRLGDESGANASSVSAIGTASTLVDSTSGTVDSRSLAATAAGGGVGAPSLQTADDVTAVIAGAQSQNVSTGDYRGLAAAECTRPSSDSWLVGGSTATGRTTLLTLANPGSVSTTVTLELFSDEGLVDAAGTAGIIVAAGSQRVVSLAGLAPSEASLTVHVTSRGGPVVASLQQSVVRGIDPGGIDIVGQTTGPATRQVIPGVTVSNSLEVQSLLGEEEGNDLDMVLRVFVPGETSGRATVLITPSDPEGTGGSFTLDLEAGVVTDVPMDHLADGSYSVQVDSDIALVAAVRASTASDGDVDLAWFTAAEELAGDTHVAVAPGPGATINISNTSAAAATVVLDGMSIPVAGASTVSIAVADGTMHSLTGTEGLFASVTYAGRAGLAAYAVRASAGLQPAVTVYP